MIKVRADNMECFSREEQCNDPLQDQKEPTESSVLEVKDPLAEQPSGPSKELNEIITVGQDNIYDGQDFLLTDVNIVKLEESLQNSSPEPFSQTQDKVLPMVNNDKEVEKIVILSNESQNFGKKDVTEFRKRIQNLQREFNCLC